MCHVTGNMEERRKELGPSARLLGCSANCLVSLSRLQSSLTKSSFPEKNFHLAALPDFSFQQTLRGKIDAVLKKEERCSWSACTSERTDVQRPSRVFPVDSVPGADNKTRASN